MGALERNHFLLRKLHSLSGLLPVGFFLIEHFITNSFSQRSPQAFDTAANTLEGLPFLAFLELLILIPLFYHAFFGIWVAMIAKYDTVPRYSYPRNWAFYAMRVSGFLTLAFILFHLWEFRWYHLLGQLGYRPETPYTFSWVASHLNNPAIFAFYVIAIIGTCFHFANGMWEFCIDWGFTIGPKAQRISLAVWTIFFFAMSGLGLYAAAGFRKAYPVSQLPSAAAVQFAAPMTTTAR